MGVDYGYNVEMRIMRNMNCKTVGSVKRKFKKSRVGCPQCKARKVKCDETLPFCTNCKIKSLRCGYLDYTQRDRDIVRIAQWEAQGSDPSKNPVQAQQYNPLLNPVIIQHRIPDFNPDDQDFCSPLFLNCFSSSNLLEQSSPIKCSLQFSDSTCSQSSHMCLYDHVQSPLLINNFDPRYLPSVSYNQSQYQLSPPSFLLSSTPSTSSIGSRSPSSPMFDFGRKPETVLPSQVISTPSSDSSFSAISSVSLQNYFEIPMVKHIVKGTEAELKDIGELKQSSDDILLKRFIWTDVIAQYQSIPENECLLNGLMLFTTSLFSTRYDNLRGLFMKYRGCVINYLLKELPDVHDLNSINLLRMTNYLDISSIYNQLENGYDDYKKFLPASLGQSSLLRKVYGDPQNFVNSFEFFKDFGELFILKNFKQLCVPKVDNIDILIEFQENLKLFGETSFKAISRDDVILDQYNDLLDFIKLSLDLLRNKDSKMLNHSIKSLYSFLQYWFKIFPSDYFTINSSTNPIKKVFYLFWYSLIKILESLFEKARFFFGFLLDGYILSEPLLKADTVSGSCDSDLKKCLNYLCRVNSFFNKGKTHISKDQIINFETNKRSSSSIPFLYCNLKNICLERCHHTSPLEMVQSHPIKSAPLNGLVKPLTTFSSHPSRHEIDLPVNINSVSSLSTLGSVHLMISKNNQQDAQAIDIALIDIIIESRKQATIEDE